MSLIKSAIVFSFFSAALACTPKQLSTAKTITDISGVVCEAVFVAVDPLLAPLCTTALDIAKAVEALIAQQSTVSPNGKLGGHVTHVPTNTEVYTYLVTHGAKVTK